MVELKKPTTYDEQIDRLKAHGVSVHDEEFCRCKLAEINYYRLGAYFLPFREGKEQCVEGTTFEQVYHIYEFDRKLRRIMFSALEEVEIFLRAKLAYFHAHKYGPEGYLVPDNFSEKHDPEKFAENLKREIKSCLSNIIMSSMRGTFQSGLLLKYLHSECCPDFLTI